MFIMISKAQKVYDLIGQKASTNELVQGVSGVLGFPWTLVADAGCVFTHYGPMFNEIRAIYGKEPMHMGMLVPILEGCKAELFADIVFDKIVGQIPFVGIATNVMCAKTLTWRLGLLFAMLSAQDKEITAENANAAMRTIREAFPQKNMFFFSAPKVATVEKLLEPDAEATDKPFTMPIETILL